MSSGAAHQTLSLTRLMMPTFGPTADIAKEIPLNGSNTV